MGKNGTTRIHSLMKLLAMLLGSTLYKLLVRRSIALGGISEIQSIEKRENRETYPHCNKNTHS